MRIRRLVRFVTRSDVGGFRLIMALFLAIGVAQATETTTAGVGELVREALDARATTIALGP